MESLADLKLNHCIMQGLVDKHPKFKPYQHEAEKAKRLVQARERQVFCTVKEQ